MRYMGGKTRFAKYLLPIILKNRKRGQFYVEPFCGSLGTMSEVHGNRIAGDVNKYLIAMWIGLQQGRKVRTKITREIWDLAKEDFKNGTNKNFDDFTIGWIAFISSFRGRMFQGFGVKDQHGRNYSFEDIRSILEIAKNIHNIQFHHCNYYELPIPDDSIIYCDPPYQDTTGYLGEEFDSEKFWEWCRVKYGEGHQIFISEYKAPKDFICIWKLPTVRAISHQKTANTVEKLFTLDITRKPKIITIPKLFQ